MVKLKMNERIKELAEQAGIDFFNSIDIENIGRQYCEAWTEQQEKFAELIVRECMTTVLKESKWYWDKDEFKSSNAVQNAARRVKEHFGVEE